MAGIPITTLATVFGVITLAVPAAIAYRYRRRPIVALINADERRAAFHRETLTGLDAAIAAARAEGKAGEAARLEPERAVHARALQAIEAGREFSGQR